MAKKITSKSSKNAVKTVAKKSPAKATKSNPAKTTVATPAKTTGQAKVTYPEKYNISSMLKYVSKKNDITQKQMKSIWETVFDLIEKGVMKGERVPIGTMGKIYVHNKPARKARKGRNPRTGEEITIPAKKSTKVPKMRFSKFFKENVQKGKTGK
jgi:nucleoid DNA-binding protein